MRSVDGQLSPALLALFALEAPLQIEQGPLASIVIVNWNGLRWLRQLLPSLGEQSFRDFEIIVVDNGSSDGSLEFLRQAHPEVRVVPLKENFGFAAGSNAGIRASRGKYVVLLNNDTRPERDWLAELARAAEADASVGMCAPLILDADRTDLLDSAGIAVSWDGFSRQARHGERPPEDLPAQECLVPSGCAGLYRREMLDQIGLLDEDFFCYCEDTDLGLRGRFAGWKCVLCPGARVHHYYSQSGGRALAKKIFWVERNHYCVAIKNYPWFLVLALPATSLWRLGLQLLATLRGRASGKIPRGDLSVASALRAFGAAYLSLFVRLPRMFLKRRRVQAIRKLSPRQCYRLIRTYQVSVADVVFN
jgi:GT2 family glycosyltransferase